jgi:glutathione S-transferase
VHLVEQKRKLELPMAGAANDDLKVLGVWTSPFVIRVRIVLNLKGLAYEYVEEDLGNKSALLVGSNPVHKSVPVLLHAGRAINESQIILQYIDEVWAGTGPAVLPSDPYERAAARFWAAYIDDKVRSAWLGMLFRCKNEEERAEAVARAGEALDTLEGAFRDCSKGGKKPFFGGDGIGFVDVVLGGYLGWFGAVGKIIGRRLIDPARTPLLAAWEDRFRAADVAKGVVPDDVDKVLAFLQTLLAISK